MVPTTNNQGILKSPEECNPAPPTGTQGEKNRSVTGHSEYPPLGFHRKADDDDTKIKLKPGIEASAEGVSLQTLVSEAGYTQSSSAGRSSDNAKEKGPDMDLEEKPRLPPQVLSGALADGDTGRDQPTIYKKDLFSFLLEVPVMNILSLTLIGELQGPTMEPVETPRQLEAATQVLRMLKDAGITPGAFNASELIDLETLVI
ncbi:hypothetical protein PHMEG_00012152 [Phytophthora megakarya]|uniref:Uncharacterized protein n=1 Tax=Phytophthora megakarya TaxID=4795 RepID=A0A225WB61_9STRA|nr:hypothetical protein PHMEG_00012152 [Phytophthora megakarya]